jgi:hypothetical protein
MLLRTKRNKQGITAVALSFVGPFHYSSQMNQLGTEFPTPIIQLFDVGIFREALLDHIEPPATLRITVTVEKL